MMCCSGMPLADSYEKALQAWGTHLPTRLPAHACLPLAWRWRTLTLTLNITLTLALNLTLPSGCVYALRVVLIVLGRLYVIFHAINIYSKRTKRNGNACLQ